MALPARVLKRPTQDTISVSFRTAAVNFYMSAARRSGEPDLGAAAVSRAAELAMVFWER
jgi:hypothetical protein